MKKIIFFLSFCLLCYGVYSEEFKINPYGKLDITNNKASEIKNDTTGMPYITATTVQGALIQLDNKPGMGSDDTSWYTTRIDTSYILKIDSAYTHTINDTSETDPVWNSEKSNYVPYSGASADLDLGNYYLGAGTIVNLNHQLKIRDDNAANCAILDTEILSTDRVFQFPDTSGTFALTLDLDSKQDSLPSIVGNAGKYLRVKSDTTGLEWETTSGGGSGVDDTTWYSSVSVLWSSVNTKQNNLGYTPDSTLTFAGQLSRSGNTISLLPVVHRFIITSPTASSDYPLGAINVNRTVTRIEMQCYGSTGVGGMLWQYNSTGTVAINAIDSVGLYATTNSVVFDASLSSASVSAGNYYFWVTDSTNGNPVSATITFWDSTN